MERIPMSSAKTAVDDRLLGLETAAGWLGLSVWTLRKWIQEGKIKSAKLGSRRLIPMSEVRRLIEAAMK
ncbi:MAG: helix-turn-helix domain-containing protein [Acidobacteria bacterium]|nr:helix-turn-helix domain-containing protein [Acidobacteriota bacterium]MCW5969430.1 helix-turn-helix domain-containing protein [Blastocatellales bacterium]